MKNYLVVFLVFCSICVNAQNFVSIDTQSFKTSQFKELDFLKRDLSDVKIISLGEAAHNMGGTHTAKIKMVKYLHEKLHFNTLAFESPLYNLEKIYNKNDLTQTDLKRNISGVWVTDEMNELYEYIVETQKTSSPLRVTGFDESFFPDSHLKVELSVLVEDLEANSNTTLGCDSLFYKVIDDVVDKCYYFSKIKKADTLLLFNKFKLIKKFIKTAKTKEKGYYRYWDRIINNLQSVYRKNYDKSDRENQMATNTNYLLEKNPNEKLMLWGATTHLYASSSSLKDARFNKMKNMGKMLRDKFAEKYYMLSFTPYTGKFGFKGYLGIAKSKVKSKKGSLEYYIANNYDSDYVFVSLRDKEEVNEIKINNIKSSHVVWFNGKFGNEPMDVSTVSDGIFYLKTERLINYKIN